MRPEQRRVVMPLPERKRGENDLLVYFLPGDKVLLGGSDNAFSPYDPRSPNYTPRSFLKENNYGNGFGCHYRGGEPGTAGL